MLDARARPATCSCRRASHASTRGSSIATTWGAIDGCRSEARSAGRRSNGFAVPAPRASIGRASRSRRRPRRPTRPTCPAPELLFLPYLQGERTPIWNEDARGVFFGLDLSHAAVTCILRSSRGSPSVFVIAWLSRAKRAARPETPTWNSSLPTAPAKARSLRQTLADALGAPLTWTSDVAAPATVRGAAILAGLGCGVLADPRPGAGWAAAGDAANGGASVVRHEPNPRAHERLEHAFVRRLALYDAVRGAFSRPEWSRKTVVQ